MNTPLKLMTLIIIGSMLTACAGGGPSHAPATIPTPAKAEALQKPANDAAVFVNKALAAIEAIQAGKESLTMPSMAAIHENLVQAKAALATVNEALPAVVKSAVADAKEVAAQGKQIAELKKADPIVAKLNWIGVGLLVLSLGAIGAGIWLNIPMARNGGLAGAGVALGILTLATYLHTLEWIIGGTALVCVVGGGVWWLLHRKVSTAKQTDDAQYVPLDKYKAMEAFIKSMASTPAPGAGLDAGAGALGNVMSTPASPIEGVVTNA